MNTETNAYKHFVFICNFCCHCQTRAKYLSVGKQMKLYEDQKYESWREHVEQILPSLLKRNLIVKPTHAQQVQLQQQQAGEDGGDGDGMCRILFICYVWLFNP